jgi:hypothetical protein
MNEKPPYQTPQILLPNKNSKLFTLRNVALIVCIIFLSNIIFGVFNSVTNKYSPIQQIYKSTFNEGYGASVPIGHYRIKYNSVYYYQACSNPFSTWCKHKLEGVKPEDFTPLSKDFAKIYKNNQAHIYQAHIDITDKIKAPENFRALEKIESNPHYFSDDDYLYYLENTSSADLYYLENPSDEYSRHNKHDGSFPLKITSNDVYETPVKFQTPYDINGCQSPTEVLLLNNQVYLDGILLPEADAKTFEKIQLDSTTDVASLWFKDKNKVYLYGHKVVDADPYTIKIHNKPETNGSSCSGPYAYIASDKNNVYYAEFQPKLIFCDSGQEFCNVDIKIPDISPLGLTAEHIDIRYPLSSGETISNNSGTYYLDGLQTNTDELVRILVSKDWGREYYEVNAIKNRYRIYYAVKTGQCSVKETVRSEKQFRLYINDKLIGRLEFCDRFFDEIPLSPGVNKIRVMSEDDRVVFKREYVVQN